MSGLIAIPGRILAPYVYAYLAIRGAVG